MRISKSVYGYIIVFIFLGGLILTKMLGVWEIHDRESGRRGNHKSAPAVHDEIEKN